MKPRLFSNSRRLGFGCSGAWGMRWFSQKRAIRLVRQAIDLGVTHFDTAGFYGGGEAEKRLGRALEGIDRDSIFVSTKTGTRLDRYGRAYKDFSDAGMRSDVETSLKRLGGERLDLLYLHGPSARQIEETRDTLSRLKEEGKIAAIGVCSVGAALDYAVDKGAADAIMGVYNFFQREHVAVFARAAEKGLGVAAAAPLAQGLYRKGFFFPRSFPDLWGLARALVNNRATLARARKPEAEILHSIEGWKAAEVALAFTLSNPHIDVAVATTTKPRHLDGLAAAAVRPPPPEVAARLDPAPLDPHAGDA